MRIVTGRRARIGAAILTFFVVWFGFAWAANATVVLVATSVECSKPGTAAVTFVATNEYPYPVQIVGYGLAAGWTTRLDTTARFTVAGVTAGPHAWGVNVIDRTTGAQINSTGNQTVDVDVDACPPPTTAAPSTTTIPRTTTAAPTPPAPTTTAAPATSTTVDDTGTGVDRTTVAPRISEGGPTTTRQCAVALDCPPTTTVSLTGKIVPAPTSPGPRLPVTGAGGAGTVAVLGGGLIAAGVLVLAARRRMSVD